ncbi:MAG: hypothetical protein K2X66_15620 [Cyanobacteria bacterium]|nr:hypothetical protein [Cyanobacteriota bacterium]
MNSISINRFPALVLQQQNKSFSKNSVPLQQKFGCDTCGGMAASDHTNHILYGIAVLIPMAYFFVRRIFKKGGKLTPLPATKPDSTPNKKY